MIVTCPNCQTKYNLPDAKVPAGGAKVKCSKCAHVFKAAPPAPEPATPEEEVENLFEQESSAPDTSAGDAFDETFDEVSTGRDKAAADDGGMDDLFGDDEPGGDAGGDAAADGADDVDSLFGDEDDLFGDDEPEAKDEPVQEDSEGAEDLFATGDDDDAGDLFASGDEEEEDEEEEEEDEDDDDGGLDLDDDEPVRSRKPLGCLIILLVLALLIGGAVWFKAWRWFGFDVCSYIQNVPYVGKLCMEETGGGQETAPGESPADRVRNIVLKNVKQYYVANEKTGNLFVVEGKAVNQFTTPKERIKVEVVLYDGTGNVLVTQSFLCGNLLSQFQLQVQTRPEIEEGLKSEVGILSNNTFIRPGASTPFMAVFFEPPAGVKEFLVKVVDVGDPK